MGIWSLIISAAALVVSVALGLREFLARPIPFGWVYALYQNNAGHWELIGHQIHVTNIGRRPFTVELVGVLNETDKGVQGVAGPFEWLPGEKPVDNPETPFMLQPGELRTFKMPVQDREEQGRPFGAQIVLRNRWRWLPKQRDARRKWVRFNVPKASASPHADET